MMKVFTGKYNNFQKAFLSKYVLIFVVFLSVSGLWGCNTMNENTKVELENISEDNIKTVYIKNLSSDTDQMSTYDIDLENAKLTINKENFDLTNEQCQEIRKLVLDYTYRVEEQKDDYWPKTEEYSDMKILFDYKIEYGEETYSMDGALCYPDGWDEFISALNDFSGKS